MSNSPDLSYTPKKTSPSSEVNSISEDLKAKYPDPHSNTSLKSSSDPFSKPALGFKSNDSYKVAFSEKGVNTNEIYTQLSDGSYEAKFKNYITGTNNAERLAQQQTTGEKWSHGVQKFLGKTTTAVAGGTIGSVVGFAELLSTGSLEAMYNNDFNKWLDTLNEKMDNRLPNYYTEQERQEGFIGSLDNANFWANDALGGLSFTIGTIVSEAIWGAATGGASLVAGAGRLSARLGMGGFRTARDLAKANSAAARVGKELLRSGQFSAKTAKNIGRTVEGLNTARFVYTSAGYEAGVEARSFMKEAEGKFMRDFEQQNGRQPSAEEWADFQSELNDTANAVFTTNGVLVGSSNLAVFGRMFDVPNPISPLTKGLNKGMFGIGYKQTTKEGRKVLEALNPTKLQKFNTKAYSIMKAPVVEGVWEEGMQAVTANGAENWLMSRFDEDSTENSLGIIEAAYEGMAHTYGSKEGWKEIGLGMIIGLFGGGIATGGKFNEVSQSREAFNSRLAHLNTHSAENTLEVFKTQNQIDKALRDVEEAERRGDLLGKDLATKKLLYTNARANERFGREDAAQDFKAAMEGLDDSYFESLGLDKNSDTFEQEKEGVKKNLMETYSAAQKEYKSNRKAAEYLVGRGGIAGVENTEDLVEAVAYNLTMGEHADDVAKMVHDEIKIQMAGELGENVSNALEAQTVLNRAHKRTRERFYYHRKRAKKAERDLENALERLKQFESMSRDTNIDIDQKIRKAQREVEKYTTRQAEERELMRQTFGMAKSENPYNSEKIYESATSDDINTLEKAEEYLSQGEEYLNNLKETNPSKYHTLSKLFNEYHKANYAFKQFNDTVQGLANDSLKIKEYNDFLSKKLYKGQENNEFTQEWIDKNLKAYQEFGKETAQNYVGTQAISQAQRREALEEKLFAGEDLTEEEKELYEAFKEDTDTRVKARKVAKKMMEQDFLEGDDLDFYNENRALVDNFIQKEEEGDGITPPKPKKAPKPKTLKERIQQAIDEDTAVQAYVGEDFDEVESKKPTKKEAEEFDKLMERKKKSATGRGRRPDPNVEPLSEEEQERYDELEEKFSKWRIVDGSIDPDGYSMLDMFEAMEQEKRKPEKSNIKTEVSEEEAVEVKTVGDQDGTKTIDDVNFIQTYENVKVKVNKNTNKFVFSHLNIGTILSKFSMGSIQIKSPKGSQKTLTPELLNKYGKTEGTRFTIFLPNNKIVTLTIEEKGRISVPTEEFKEIQDVVGMKLVNTNLTKNSYFDVYQEVDLGGEKKFVPMRSEFKIETITGAGEVLLEPAELEKLDKGDEVTFRVNMKSAYNHELSERLNKEGLKEKERKKIIEEIEKSLEIYVMTSDGRVVGVVKAAPEGISGSVSQSNHLVLRKLAAEKFIEQSGTAFNTPIDLEASVPVSRVLTGTPSLELKETPEGLTPQNIDFTDRAVEEVLDFGFKEGDNYNTNGNTDVSEVMTSPLKNLGKGEKVPFVVFKHGKSKIAYPVSLKTVNNLGEINRIADINNTQTLDASEKILAINEVLLENGISPKKYQLMNTSAKEIDSKIDQIMEDMSKKQIAPNLERWLSGDKSVLKTDAKISIDLTNRPIRSPKLAVNFGALDIPGAKPANSAGSALNVPNKNQVNNQINNC